MTTNFELTEGRNRALVCYCDASGTELELAKNAIKNVFDAQNISCDDASDVALFPFPAPVTTLNIALKWGETARRLRVGGSFVDVSVGIYFYNQPDPPEPEIVFIPTDELGNPIGEPEYSEPEPAPSITSLVCNALQAAFPDGKIGASSFVISPEQIDFELDIE